VDVSGAAADNEQIEKVVWRNSTGESGVCYGNGNWQATGIPLKNFWNIITVTAVDLAGNTSETSLNVFCWRR
jgi:hypothetical protein